MKPLFLRPIELTFLHYNTSPCNCLYTSLRDFHLGGNTITWGVFIPMSLECLVHGSCNVHPLLLRKYLVQYCWIALCMIYTLFIPYCLGNSLVQYCWKVLCAIRILFVPYYLGSTWSNAVGLPCAQLARCSSPIVFGESLLPLYFRETLFLVRAILLPLFTWAFCSFSFGVSSVY